MTEEEREDLIGLRVDTPGMDADDSDELDPEEQRDGEAVRVGREDDDDEDDEPTLPYVAGIQSV